MRDYRFYLDDILAAMEGIGKAAEQIPDDLRNRYREIPWKEMAGMRDRLIHLYFGVDYQLVWTAIKQRLPRLRAEIRKMQNDLA